MLIVIHSCCCSVAQLCPTLCATRACSTPGFPVLHYSLSLLKLVSIESVMPFNHLILCHPLPLLPSVFPSIRVFSNELTLSIRWKSIRASASASVLPVNTQGWFCLTMFAAGYGFMISIGKNSLWDQRRGLSHSEVYVAEILLKWKDRENLPAKGTGRG